jgi:hypothetical protein
MALPSRREVICGNAATAVTNGTVVTWGVRRQPSPQVREMKSVMRAHISGALEYIGKWALRLTWATSTPLAARVSQQVEAHLDTRSVQLPGDVEGVVEPGAGHVAPDERLGQAALVRDPLE